MTTALWIALCAGGLVVGFVGGFGYRRRQASPGQAANPKPSADSASPAGSGPTDSPDQPSVVSAPDFSGPKAPDQRPMPVVEAHGARVIDLRRPVPAPARAAHPAKALPDAARLEPQTERADAQVIDLRERSHAAVAVHNLQFVKGIGPLLDWELRRHGVISLADFVALDDARIDQLDQAIAVLRAKRVRNKLQPRAAAMLEAAAAGATATPPDTSELRRVHGIGHTMARWLETREITTLTQLAALDDDDIAELQAELTAFPGRIVDEGWVNQARQLTRPSLEST